MTKIQRYKALVKQRKACTFCFEIKGVRMNNPATIMGGIYDTEHIGSWSEWKGDLDARVVIVGKDWGSKKYFIDNKGTVNPNNSTNKNLVRLMTHAGIDLLRDRLFFTNAVLCMKDGNLSESIRASWRNNCATRYLRPLLDLIHPEIIITLGETPFQAVMKGYGLKGQKMSEAVNQQEPIDLGEGMKLFPVYHCGQQPINQFGWSKHMKDWERIRPYVLDPAGKK